MDDFLIFLTTSGQKYFDRYIFEFIISFSVLVLPAQIWGVGRETSGTGGVAQRISLRKLKSGPHTKLDCFNKSVQLHMLTHFNGSTTDLCILTHVSKYTEISQADISSLKPVQIFSGDTTFTQLSQLQNLLWKVNKA